jgi:hypothetical protein
MSWWKLLKITGIRLQVSYLEATLPFKFSNPA